jgi:putative endonuclease
MSERRQRLGALGEDAAKRWYEARGYEIVDRNWRVREGEVDLVARRGSMIVFCEVKTRSSDRFGVPVESVTATKQRRLRTLAGRLAVHPAQR